MPAKAESFKRAGKKTVRAELEVATTMPAKIKNFRRVEQEMVRVEVGGEYSNAFTVPHQVLGPPPSNMEKEPKETKRLDWEQVYDEHLRIFKRRAFLV